MHSGLLWGYVLGSSALLFGCGGYLASTEDGGGPGTEARPCLSNGTCNAGLTCLSNLCVRPADGGNPTDAAPTTPVKGTYYLACLPNLSFGDVNKVFRFYAESQIAPSSGGGRMLTLTVTPMTIRDNMGALLPANTLKLSPEDGGTFAVMNAPVDGNGKFTANFMTVMFGRATDPITWRDITVENTTIVGILPPPDGGLTDYCGGLSGHVVAPIDQDLGPPTTNPCLFKALQVGDPLPVQQAGDFICPGL